MNKGMTGETVKMPLLIPYRGRHVIKWTKVTKGYKYNCGYGFYVGNSTPKFYKNLKIFGFKNPPNLRNYI